MGGAAEVGAGLGIMGGTLGGIGDIISAQNYHRPRLPEATGPEKRLRQLAQDQLLAGGQQLLGGTALYNQMVPMLMGQLPGMHYVPGEDSMGGVAEQASGGGSSMASYQDSLRNYQEAQSRNQQLLDLKRQRKAAKGPEKKALGKQVKALKKTVKASPTVPQTERRAYMAGTTPNSEIYDIRQAAGPSTEQSLGAIRGMMDALSGTGPNLMGPLPGVLMPAKRKNVPQPPRGGRGAGGGGGGKKKQGRNVPQPPAPTTPEQPQAAGGYYEYQQPVSQQLQQPYEDTLMGGAMGALPSMYQRYGQQGQMGDIYGQGAASQLGGAAQGMQGLSQLGGGYTGASGQSLGQYGQLMDPNLQIQQGLAQQIRDIQGGKADFDPYLTQQFGDQERLLREQLRRNLGGDYETSSAGIEALGKFGQNKTTALGSAQFNRLNELLNQQQAGMGNMAGTGLNFGQFGQGVQGQQFGQGQQLGNMYGNMAGQLYDQGMGFGQAGQNAMQNALNQTGQRQQLYSNIPQTMAQFGQAMSGQAGQTIAGSNPYQQDRMAQLQASYAPTSGQYAGQMMGQSGDRWVQVGSSMMGGGGGGGGAAQTNQWGGAAGTGQGDPYWQQRWNNA